MKRKHNSRKCLNHFNDINALFSGGVAVAHFSKTIGFIGSGNMGEAMIGAILQADLFAPQNVIAADINTDRLKELQDRYGIQTCTRNTELFTASDVIILAVKPQQAATVLGELADQKRDAVSYRKLMISIMAGVTLQKLESILYSGLDENGRRNMPIMRVMPNTPALVLRGMAGMTPNGCCTPDDIQMTRSILSAMGKVIEFEEAGLDAVTAISGSGPAYIFYFIESMIEAGVKLGLDASISNRLALETAAGAIKLLEERNETPETLRKKVTSPGGTTEAALKIFENKGVKKGIVDGILMAAERSRELSRA